MRPSRVREVRRASFVSRLHDYRVVSLPPRRRSVQVVPVYEMLDTVDRLIGSRRCHRRRL